VITTNKEYSSKGLIMSEETYLSIECKFQDPARLNIVKKFFTEERPFFEDELKGEELRIFRLIEELEYADEIELLSNNELKLEFYTDKDVMEFIDVEPDNTEGIFKEIGCSHVKGTVFYDGEEVPPHGLWE